MKNNRAICEHIKNMIQVRKCKPNADYQIVIDELEKYPDLDVDEPTYYNGPILWHAKGNLELVKYLKEKKNATLEDEYLYTLLTHSLNDVLEYFLEMGANPNYREWDEDLEEYESSLLSTAFHVNNLEGLKLILKYGAKLHFDEDFFEELARVHNRHPAIINFLIENREKYNYYK